MKKAQIEECWKHINQHTENIEELAGLTYEQAAQLVEDGNFCCYFWGARNFLRGLYGESEDEADQYDDATVWARYKHVLALAISKHFRYSKINA